MFLIGIGIVHCCLATFRLLVPKIYVLVGGKYVFIIGIPLLRFESRVNVLVSSMFLLSLNSFVFRICIGAVQFVDKFIVLYYTLKMKKA